MTFKWNRDREILHLVPQIEELRLGAVSFYDIAEYYAGRSHFAFLDSRLHDHNLGKYSFIAFDPFLIFKSKGNKVWTRQGETVRERIEENIFDSLNAIMTSYQIPVGTGKNFSPFLGGGIGYFAYELGRQIEILPVTARDVMRIPESYVCFYNAVVIYQHEKRKMYISYFDPGCECSILSMEHLKEEIASIPPGLYNSTGISPGWKTSGDRDILTGFRSDFTRQEYMDAVNRIKEYILAGDVYQADLTQRFETDMDDIPPWDLYKRLMHINPAPFASYLNFEDVTVVSSSPERFLIVNGSYVETRPIKGTVKRGPTPEEDRENKEFLYNDEKNRAELAMIVDLMRNDIGRVCRAGSVKVRAFPELETYSSVHHLVSTITGKLAEGKNVVDVLKATFPGGSITGAPKIRAMEILDELEPVERGIYTGSIGYLGFNGCADLNIVIRTIVITGKKAHIQAGGGIVADSVDCDEYEETLLKAQKLFKAFISEK
jgi:para-aminobenzoate synthetase component 1